MVNILPKTAQDEIRTLYYLRLASTLMFLLAIVFLIEAALLAPSYLLAQNEAAAAKEYTATLQQTLALKESTGGAAALSVFAEEVSLLKSYYATPAIADVLSALTSKLPKGVSLYEILIVPPATTDGKVQIVGSAKTRAELLAFVASLQSNTLFKSVAVPVSDLVGDSNLPFTLSFFIVGKPK